MVKVLSERNPREIRDEHEERTRERCPSGRVVRAPRAPSEPREDERRRADGNPDRIAVDAETIDEDISCEPDEPLETRLAEGASSPNLEMADGVRAREGDEVLRADDGDERRAPGERGRGRDEQSPKPRSAGGEREERQQERGPREARAEAETDGDANPP